jgi:hypothetical protein
MLIAFHPKFIPQCFEPFRTQAQSAKPLHLEGLNEEDGQSDDSQFHTPAQRSKRRRLLSVSPKKKREDIVAESESDSFERDSLFDSPPSRKRCFRRPRKPWSLVREWSLMQYDKEVIYEQIKAIVELSLDDAGSKNIARLNPSSIARWRRKQQSILNLSRMLAVH